MSRSAAELDLFRLVKDLASEDNSSPPSVRPKLMDRRRSFREIQSVISKINPEVLKAVIETGSAIQNGNHSVALPTKTSVSVPSTPVMEYHHNPFPVLPVYAPTFRPVANSQNGYEPAPLTIFYNGTVAVFDVPQEKAEDILKLVEAGSKFSVPASGEKEFWETLKRDLPIARTKSLQSFLQKRKERLIAASPYAYPTKNAVSGQKATSPRG